MLKSPRKIHALTGIPWEHLHRVSESVARHYSSFDLCVQPQSGGQEKWRHIDNPMRDLKGIQRRLLRRVLPLVSLRGRMFGAKRGASIENHAKIHVGREAILTVDLKSYFPKTRSRSVYTCFVKEFGCSPDVARVLTRLTTLNGSLPQGAPTSGYLAHVCLLGLFDELDVFCKLRGLRLSFYMDDIAISGRGPVVAGACSEVARMIQRHGHGISGRKTKVMFDEDRIVTGLQVDTRVTVPTSYVDRLEEDLEEACRAGHVSTGSRQSLEGRIAWVERYEPAKARELGLLLQFVGTGPDGMRSSSRRVPCKQRTTCAAQHGGSPCIRTH